VSRSGYFADHCSGDGSDRNAVSETNREPGRNSPQVPRGGRPWESKPAQEAVTLAEITLSQRLTLLLDASPLNGIQRWLWVLSTGGTLLDGLAIFVLGVAMPLIIAEFRFNPDVVGLIGAGLVLGAVFGAGFGGLIAWYAARGCDYARAAENRRQRAELATFPGERRRHRLSVFPATSFSARQSELVHCSGWICRGGASVHPDHA